MKFINVAKVVLMILGVVFIFLMIYTKFAHINNWNKESGPDLVQEFTRAYINMLDGTIRVVEIKSWRDYEYSDQIQITTTSGITYLTHASRLIMTNEPIIRSK